MKTKQKPGRPPVESGGRARRNLNLSDDTVAILKKAGDGNVSEGARVVALFWQRVGGR